MNALEKMKLDSKQKKEFEATLISREEFLNVCEKIPVHFKGERFIDKAYQKFIDTAYFAKKRGVDLPAWIFLRDGYLVGRGSVKSTVNLYREIYLANQLTQDKEIFENDNGAPLSIRFVGGYKFG